MRVLLYRNLLIQEAEMEERKLNFNAPLLSVRRFSMASSSFSAEEDKKNPENYICQSESEFIFDQVTEPVAVPFHWEFIPGRSKNGHDEPEIKQPIQFHKALITPKYLQNSRGDDQREISLGNERESEDFEKHDAYAEESETLSSSDSLSLYNFSISGLSGSDGPDLKPSGTFSIDPQTLAFIMARFLPAASAVAINTINYVCRKQLVEVLELKNAVGELISRSRSSPLRQSKEASPYRIENPQSFEVPKANRLDLHEKTIAVIDCEVVPGELNSGSERTEIEKRLRVDSVNIREISSSISNIPNSKRKAKVTGDEIETRKVIEEKKEITTVESHSRRGNPESPNAGESNPSELPSSIMDEQHEPESESLQCSKSKNEENKKPGEALDKIESNSHRPPPLPKSPPESWLRRTLPSISSDNWSSRSILGNRRQSKKNPKITSAETSKWETIVKTSNRRHDHLRYSEELLPRVSQHYKS